MNQYAIHGGEAAVGVAQLLGGHRVCVQAGGGGKEGEGRGWGRAAHAVDAPGCGEGGAGVVDEAPQQGAPVRGAGGGRANGCSSSRMAGSVVSRACGRCQGCQGCRPSGVCAGAPHMGGEGGGDSQAMHMRAAGITRSHHTQAAEGHDKDTCTHLLDQGPDQGGVGLSPAVRCSRAAWTNCMHHHRQSGCAAMMRCPHRSNCGPSAPALRACICTTGRLPPGLLDVQRAAPPRHNL